MFLAAIEQASDMGFRGGHGDAQGGADLLVGVAEPDQAENLPATGMAKRSRRRGATGSATLCRPRPHKRSPTVSVPAGMLTARAAALSLACYAVMLPAAASSIRYLR